MTTHKPRLKLKKIPLSTGSFKNFSCINTELIKNNCQLIHKGNIKISLGILDDFCSLSSLYRRSTMNPRNNYLLIQLSYLIQSLGRIARYNFQNFCQCMLFIAWINSLGRIANKEVLLPLHARFPFQNRNTYIFSCTRINR